jgi:hypothetical protein
MTSKTFERRLQQLIEEIMQHPHREELLQIAADQLEDDTVVLSTYS